MTAVKRIFVEKKPGFDLESKGLLSDIKESLHIDNIRSIRVLNRYDVEGIDDETLKNAAKGIFSEPNMDDVYYSKVDIKDGERVFAKEFLPGQYDQRADWAEISIQLLNDGKKPIVNSAKLYIIDGDITDDDFSRIKSYCINAVDSREAKLEIPETINVVYDIPTEVETLDGFIDLDEKGLGEFLKKQSLAMTFDDLLHIQKHFKNDEKRNPTITEIKVLDTYWSDHCRHTTFMTELSDVRFEDGKYNKVIEETYKSYLADREKVYVDRHKDISLMDIGTLATKKLKKDGVVTDLDESEEINACSINIDVDIDGAKKDYLLMFKNETHNHPTEIEPFGGAATCLGGAIRDPLSGRSYVYQAMRVTGAADPLTTIEDTLPGKLMQKKITTEAARGYSSYGNQIGLATGQVSEVYDEDFVAKRMEIGAVIAAAPKENVIRKRPEKGDVIILLGGKTGRDGIGGATGSSKEHSEDSIETASAEVQKGDAPNERKIQRFFRKAEVAQMIKRCNDFGAGGVCVAIGEIADSLDINLDLVPKKYDGLDGTELAISESQERMAVAIDPSLKDEFIKLAHEENLEATHVATVTDTGRMRMSWNGKYIVDLSRAFVDTNGVKQKNDVKVKKVDESKVFETLDRHFTGNIKDTYMNVMADLNVCSQKGLVEMFDNSIGASTVIMPFGGKLKRTPSNGMVAKIPTERGESNTASIMTWGYNPKVGKWSQYHGALYAVVESMAKMVALGADYKKTRLTFQEYFEKLGDDPNRWGKPLSALLGAYRAQMEFKTPAIGGKDSMSGTFKDIDVPPTLVSFAVNTIPAKKAISQDIKKEGSKLAIIYAKKDEQLIPDFDVLRNNFEKIYKLNKDDKILSAYALGFGGVGEAVAKMAFGSNIGFKFSDRAVEYYTEDKLFSPEYGEIIVEVEDEGVLEGLEFEVLGGTIKESKIVFGNESIDLEELYASYSKTLEPVFPTKAKVEIDKPIETISYKGDVVRGSSIKIAKPKIFIPAFPGTNCEYDSAKAFENAGGEPNIQVFRNMTYKDIEDSVDMMVENIKKSQIIMLPGGFSAGDEPDGSAKFIATVFRNEKIMDAVREFLDKNDGLMLGICNGFQALIKLGLVPYGEIMTPDESMPTLAFNNIGRHIATVADTRIASNKSPWLANTEVGDVFAIPVSHGEGRFVASDEVMKKLIENGQVATQYVDKNLEATYDINYNPNGSFYAVEGITSEDGKIFGKMGHSERLGRDVMKNIYGEKDQKLFISGVEYFG